MFTADIPSRTPGSTSVTATALFGKAPHDQGSPCPPSARSDRRASAPSRSPSPSAAPPPPRSSRPASCPCSTAPPRARSTSTAEPTRERGDQSQLIKDSIKATGARNVILFIGDGMGDSEITVARNYLEGAGGFFKGIDALPLTGQMTHYSVDKDTGKPDYTPDSAATGTAWSTGVKTYDNAISVDRHGKAYPTLLELAKSSGLATGDITTSEIQDATPAVEVSHISQRSCYGPVATTTTCPEAAKENGGRGSISEQLLDTRPDVTLGRRVDDLRRDRHGRHVEGQDARGAGQAARLPLHHRQERPRRRPHGRPGQAAARACSPRATCRCSSRRSSPRAGGGRHRAGCDLQARADLQPGARPEDDDQQVDRPALEQQGRQEEGLLPPGRERLASTRRTTRPTPAARSVRPTQLDEAVRRR